MSSTPSGKSVDFTPDEDFSSAVESGKKLYSTDHPFLKDLKRVQVEIDESTEEGRARKRQLEREVGKAIVGLYWDDDGTAHLTDKKGDEELIETTMELGVSGKGQLLVVCETGIANYVRELADDDDNHLPPSKTGVVIHYVTEGIARDFGVTFDKQPVSLGGNRGRGASKSGRDAGKIALSKAEKNLLLEKLNISYYQDDISSGTITMEEAFKKVQEALEDKMKYEEMGYFLSPNKTEGVLLYDWKSLVTKTYEDKPSIANPLQVYSRNKVEVLIPNVVENYFTENHAKANKKNASHLMKSDLAICCIDDAARFGLKGWISEKYVQVVTSDMDIESNDDILDLLKDKYGKNYTIDNESVVGIHIAKINQPGAMKPRHVVVDAVEDGRQVLYLFDGSGGVLTMKS